ncbi:hypothetical protein RUM44_008505 [Polyplax serrata]|uniref:Uncharacterized protein n=1 Tax=Polyplax serrata TaxID=468196 RepID=A0ABR1BCX2_POLSC
MTPQELLNTIVKTVLYVTAFISQLSAWSPIHHSSPPRDPNLTAGSFGLFNAVAYAAGVYYLYLDWKYSQSNSGP